MSSSFSSPLLDCAINEISKLPGIGKKSALRLVLHLLRQDEDIATALGESIIKLRKEIKYCKICHNISANEVCEICSDSKRDSSVICVVESIKDVISIENTHQFNGLYHVLGGIISPIDGISPSDIEIESLVERVAKGDISEVILALSTTMEGDTTNFYIFRKLANFNIKISILSRGVSIGDELEYTDEVTLGRSILNRMPFNESFKI